MKTANAGAQHTPAEGGQRLKIREVARLSGVRIEALRFYEKSGPLDKPARTYGGYRVYGAEVLDRLTSIKHGSHKG